MQVLEVAIWCAAAGARTRRARRGRPVEGELTMEDFVFDEPPRPSTADGLLDEFLPEVVEPLLARAAGTDVQHEEVRV